MDITTEKHEIENWQIAAIEQGLKDINNNKFISIEEIKAEWEINADTH